MESALRESALDRQDSVWTQMNIEAALRSYWKLKNDACTINLQEFSYCVLSLAQSALLQFEDSDERRHECRKN